MKTIQFFTEDTTFSLKRKTEIRSWLQQVAQREGYEILDLNYIFCSDEYILSINQQFLDHDTYTDIITFDNTIEDYKIYGEIYISIDRVKENAKNYKVTFQEELSRVMAHGVLHLCGYKDKTKKQSEVMRAKENEAIQLFHVKQ